MLYVSYSTKSNTSFESLSLLSATWVTNPAVGISGGDLFDGAGFSVTITRAFGVGVWRGFAEQRGRYKERVGDEEGAGDGKSRGTKGARGGPPICARVIVFVRDAHWAVS